MIKVETTRNLGQDFRTFDPDFPALNLKGRKLFIRLSPEILSIRPL